MNEKTEFQKQRSGAMLFGAVVYVGVVLASTTLFITFVLTAFPKDAYFTRFIMTIAGLLIGASMLAFPVALHTWAVGGTHRTVTTLLYYGEMGIVALNSIVSFASLLAKYSGYTMPEWVLLYEPFSIVAIVYTLAAWGTIFQLDPMAKSRERERQAEQLFNEKVSKKELEFLDSIEGEDAIIAAATAKVQEKYQRDYTGQPKHFGSGKKKQAALVDQLFQSETEQPNLGKSFRKEE